MKKVLCLFDYVARTGFATVSKNIVKEVKKHYGDNIQLDIIAINYFGEPIHDGNTYIISARLNDVKDDPFGRYFFLKVLAESDSYDGIFICQDLGVIVPIIEIIEHVKNEKKEKNVKVFKSIFYFPVDCNLIYELTKGIEFFDTIVTYTEFARTEVLKLRPELKGKIKVVPHGNSSKDFYPIDCQQFRKEYFGDNSEKFIITNVNRNQPRKDFPNTIFGFIEAKEIWDNRLPEPFLYLHTHPKDPMGWDLRAIMLQTKLVEDVDYKLLPKEFEDKMVDDVTLNKIYNSSDVILTTTLGEGWGLCLHPSSKVLLNNGVKEIKDVNVGEKVLTNDGTFHKVLDTTCRSVDSYIKVKTKYGFEIKVTHEHPFYSLKNGFEKYRNFKELSIGDYLAIVKSNLRINDNNTLDFAQFITDDFTYDEKYIYHKFGYSPKNSEWSISSICKKYNSTKKVVENAISYIIGKKDKVSYKSEILARQLILDGYKKNEPLKINRFTEIDDDLLYMFGWYLAEGSCENGYRLEFSLSIDELHIAKKISNIISNKFGIKDVIIKKVDNKCCARISNRPLAIAFKNMFGNGALNKRVPDFLFNYDHKKLMPLVNGYILGDGHINLNTDVINFGTISPSLAHQIQHILASNNIMLSIRLTDKLIGNYDFYICTIPASHLRRYMDLVSMKGTLDRENKRKHKPDFIETETHFFVTIKSIQEIKEKIEVYDLCVEGSHSFIADGLVCHNTFSESASCKLPIIAPYSTSLIEMSDYGKNAYMLETLYPYCNMTDNIIRHQTDIYEIAEMLELVATEKYSQSESLKNKVQKNYEWAKKLEWSEVCKKWIDYFKIY